MFLLVRTLERALVRTEQKQDLSWLLWCLWPSLNAVFQTIQLFSWVVLMQVISVSCADFQSVSKDCLLVQIHFLFSKMSSFFEAFISGAWLATFLDSSAFVLHDLVSCNICYLLLHLLLMSWRLPWFLFSSFLSVFQAWYVRRKENNLLASSPDHSAELCFKTSHICPLVCLKVFLYPEVLDMFADVTLSA